MYKVDVIEENRKQLTTENFLCSTSLTVNDLAVLLERNNPGTLGGEGVLHVNNETIHLIYGEAPSFNSGVPGVRTSCRPKALVS